MDPAIVIALITGIFGTVGAVLRIVEKYFPGKPATPELSPPLPDRPDHMDERIEWYVEKLEEQNERDRKRHEADLAEVRAECAAKVAEKQRDIEQLQKFFLEALERIESLGVKTEGKS